MQKIPTLYIFSEAPHSCCTALRLRLSGEEEDEERKRKNRRWIGYEHSLSLSLAHTATFPPLIGVN